ncbi:cytochrome c [Mesorhizobium sp. LHD-90]|uniref:c-type cytochrome n=1 Tax=Mesorhizobium sp. LHD-90 TaxID=3071414 RepID=UPI0027DFAD1C|nr:cytochrome c [Mesorhizobium sp. LHD-90]MDQ6434411.1 cytochrome c [Mesorhizobium sp. LHD-90]
MRLAAVITFGLLAGLCRTGPAVAEDGRMLYMLHCSGCHGMQGTASSLGRIPPLAGAVGYYMTSPEARIFLPQAPGIMNSGLSDADVTTLMNWLVPALAKNSLIEPFRPYTVEEIAASRASKPADFFAARRKVTDRLRLQGLELPRY